MLPHPGRGDGSARLGGQTAVSGVRTQGTDLRLSCREGQMASKTERTIINAAGLAPGVVLVTSRGRAAMADLIVIGYPDEATAYAADDEARRLARDLVIQPDAIAVIARGKDGSYHIQTSHRPLGCPARAGACSGVSMAAD
jgi:hypothetical protein